VKPALASLQGVVRRYGPVTALAGADLEVSGGEVHGVLGENGAGKSTLLGVLGGMVRPDEGQVLISGRPVELDGPRAAWRHGIGLVHQHFTLVQSFTVLENLALGRDVGTPGLGLPVEDVRAAAEALMESTGLTVPLDERAEDLGVGDRQRVEILKALLREPPLLVLDEPTAVLTPGEVGSLFGLLRQLAAEGRAVVLVAHKIDEILSVADRVTVLRRGRTVMTSARASVDAPTLVRAMVGGDAAPEAVGAMKSSPSGKGPTLPATGGTVARLSDVHVRRATGSPAVVGVSLDVRRGEIVGVAGVEGNGQRELALVLAGRLRPETGSAELPSGIGFIPQDRTVEGIVRSFDLTENVALALQDDDVGGDGFLMDWGAIERAAAGVVSRFGVVTPGLNAKAGALSGGNQQRLVAGRELLRARDLLVAENPTRGLDVAATAFLHEEITRVVSSADGPGVVLVSTDLDEVLALSTRILVMANGRLREVPADSWSREGLGALMLSRGDVHA